MGKKTKKSNSAEIHNNKPQRLVGNIIFGIYSLLLIIICIPSSIYQFTLINLVGMLFFGLTGIFLLLKTKIGLICAYILNGLSTLLGLLTTIAGIIEIVADGEESIILNNTQGMAWVMALAVVLFVWSIFYLIYYIKKRKCFTNANLN